MKVIQGHFSCRADVDCTVSLNKQIMLVIYPVYGQQLPFRLLMCIFIVALFPLFSYFMPIFSVILVYTHSSPHACLVPRQKQNKKWKLHNELLSHDSYCIATFFKMINDNNPFFASCSTLAQMLNTLVIEQFISNYNKSLFSFRRLH